MLISIFFVTSFYIKIAWSAESILYDTRLNGFANWTIKEIPHQSIFGVDPRIVPHNSTTRLNLRPRNATVFTEIHAYSDVIHIEPAWEIFVTPYVESEGKPFSSDHNCIKELLVNCGTLKIKHYFEKPADGGKLTNIHYTAFSNGKTKQFISGKKYPASAETMQKLNKYIQFQFKFWFYYPDADPPRFTFKSVNLTRLVVTYRNCPQIVSNLARYENVPAAREVKRIVVSEGSCVENAERADEKGKLIRFCDVEAQAKFFGACACSEGYEKVNNKCVECTNQHFRNNIKDALCTRCGQQTDVIRNRTVCQCIDGLVRLGNEKGIDTRDCYEYPDQPDNVKFMRNMAKYDINISWNKPNTKKYLGNFPITFTLKCTSARDVCQEKSSTTQTHATSSNMFVVKDLLPFTEYTFVICTHTNVSLSNNHEEVGQNCRKIRHQTAIGLPTKIRKLQSRIGDDGITLVWQKPLSTGSPTVKYRVSCGKNQTGSDTDITSYYYPVKTQIDTINCKVAAISSIGLGPFVEHDITVNTGGQNRENGTSTKNIAIIGGVAGAVVLLIIIGLFVFRFYRSKERNQNALVSAIETIMSMKENNLYGEQVRRELESRMRNIYVPLDVLLNQSVVELNSDEPIYEEVPPLGYNYPYRKLKKLQDLGEGNFATVSQCEATDICGRPGKSLVAVKQLKDDCNHTDELDFEGELELMQEFKSHPNVVKLLGICTYPRCMIVEYLPGGDLLSFMVRSRSYREQTEEQTSATAEGSFLTAKDLLEFAHQIVQGMTHISNCNVVHRDLACRNILVGYNRICKIADFGLARKIGDNGIYKREKQAKLPVKWLPPESIYYGRSSLKSDVWSFGIVLWEIVTIGAVPYPGKKSKEIPDLLRQGYRMAKPEHCSDELYALMTDCWSEEDFERPCFNGVTARIEDLKDGMSSYINLNVYSDDSYLSFDGDDDMIDDEEIILNVYS